MKILTVIPLKKGILRGDLTYFTSLDIPVGHIVSVPLRNNESLALVTSVEELKENKSDVKGMKFNLKKVTKDKGESLFLKEFFETTYDISKYFIQNKNNTLTSIIPTIFLEEYDKIKKIKKEEKIENNSTNSQNIKPEKFLFQYPLTDRISIYKTIVRESFARGKSVFLVLPTELDINKFTEQLSKGIEQFTYPIHGGISSKKNLITYEKIVTSAHPVLIIGTPPYISIPKKNIGTIILEHENSNAYKTIKRPHLDLRIFVEIYASKINAKFIMGDEILRFETIGRKDVDNLNPLHPLSFRLDTACEINILGKKEGEKFQILKDEAIEEVKRTLRNKKNVFIFSLRKGLATVTICKDCGETLSCDTCEAPMVLYLSKHNDKRMFVCNRCEMDKGSDLLCPTCGSWNLVPLGIGTDTVYEEVRKIFPKEKIFKLDKESAKTASGAKKIINEFDQNEGAILIGTEMTFFYFKEHVDLSIVASFDSFWSMPNFKMGERIIQIIFSILGNTNLKLIIQTKNEHDRALLAIKSTNILSFVREELEDRKNLDYPPYKRFIKMTFLGDKEETQRARNFLEEFLKDYNPEIYSGFLTKLKGKYVTNALIKIDSQKWSLPDLSVNSKIDVNLSNKLLSLPPSFYITVDPEDLL